MPIHHNELIVLLSITFEICMLIHCIFNKRLSSTERVGWLFFIVFTLWLGGLVYLLTKIVYKKTARQFPRSQPVQEDSILYQRSYEQGYREQRYQLQRDEQPYKESDLPDPQNTFDAYEQPQVSYPDLPSLEKN